MLIKINVKVININNAIYTYYIANNGMCECWRSLRIRFKDIKKDLLLLNDLIS